MSEHPADPGRTGSEQREEELSLSALDGRIRRRKRRLERMNPVVDYAAYEQRLIELVHLEARRQDALRRDDGED